MQIPILNEDPTSDDLSGLIGCYFSKMAPGQMRIYTKVVPDKYKTIDPKTGKLKIYYPNSPLGKDTILKQFREDAKILGIKNPSKFCPASLRLHFCTKLSNGYGVSDEEKCASARHSSIAANAIYQERDTISAVNKFNLLLQLANIRNSSL